MTNGLKKGSKEYYEVLQDFENFVVKEVFISGMRFDKEPKESPRVYQHGETENLFKLFVSGYILGKFNYMS